MRNIKFTKFNKITYFLSNFCEVESLEAGARTYGGATQYKNGIFSNIEGTEEITINDGLNSIALFIPSTVNVNIPVNNTKYVVRYYKKLYKKYPYAMTEVYQTKGSYYSENLDEVIIEDITILMFYFNRSISEKTIRNFINIALQVKEEMTQESVSLLINESLCIV